MKAVAAIALSTLLGVLTHSNLAQASPSADSTASSQTTVVGVASSSPNHKTLVAAAKAAGLTDTLSGTGPFTVFAPTDEAFSKLPAGTVDMLLKPENKNTLVSILTYHVIAGNISSGDLVKSIEQGHGTYTAKTLEGGSLTFTLQGDRVKITDGKGGTAFLKTGRCRMCTPEQARERKRQAGIDLAASNGVIHVIDGVLLPR